MDTIPIGILGYIDLPIITEKTTRYRNIGLTTLINLVVHTYHPEIPEPIFISLSRYQTNKQFFPS